MMVGREGSRIWIGKDKDDKDKRLEIREGRKTWVGIELIS